MVDPVLGTIEAGDSGTTLCHSSTDLEAMSINSCVQITVVCPFSQ